MFPDEKNQISPKKLIFPVKKITFSGEEIIFSGDN